MRGGWQTHQPPSNRRYHPGMRRMLTVALGTIAAVLLLVVVLFGRAHSDAIKQPAQVTLPAPASRTPAAAFTATDHRRRQGRPQRLPRQAAGDQLLRRLV